MGLTGLSSRVPVLAEWVYAGWVLGFPLLLVLRRVGYLGVREAADWLLGYRNVRCQWFGVIAFARMDLPFILCRCRGRLLRSAWRGIHGIDSCLFVRLGQRRHW
jgi:hypothetical protein